MIEEFDVGPGGQAAADNGGFVHELGVAKVGHFPPGIGGRIVVAYGDMDRS